MTPSNYSCMPLCSTSPQCKQLSFLAYRHTRRLTESCRSHIDTTGVQALIDTRTEVERWADRPIEVRSSPRRSDASWTDLRPALCAVPLRDDPLTLDPPRAHRWLLRHGQINDACARGDRTRDKVS